MKHLVELSILHNMNHVMHRCKYYIPVNKVSCPISIILMFYLTGGRLLLLK